MRRAGRWGLPIAVVLGLVAVALAFNCRTGMIERHFIYFPERDLVGRPAEVGLEYEEAHFIASDGVRLHGWFIPGERDVTWLWFHGNAGNISHRIDNLRLLQDALQVNVLLFDYRGYGQSEGSPSEEGTYRDADAALDYLLARPDVEPERIVYFGRSLGAAVAVDLAARRPPAGLIVESPFTSVSDLARHHYWFLPVWPFLHTKYDALEKIRDVDAPTLVLHGDRDDTVPHDFGQRLFEAAREPKHFYTIDGAGHNDTYVVGGASYFARLRAFVEELDNAPGPP